MSGRKYSAFQTDALRSFQRSGGEEQVSVPTGVMSNLNVRSLFIVGPLPWPGSSFGFCHRGEGRLLVCVQVEGLVEGSVLTLETKGWIRRVSVQLHISAYVFFLLGE